MDVRCFFSGYLLRVNGKWIGGYIWDWVNGVYESERWIYFSGLFLNVCMFVFLFNIRLVW